MYISYKDLEIEQKRDLDYKISTAVEAFRSALAMLRRTHPKLWDMFMRRGMAEQIMNLQAAMRAGQLSLFDIYTPDDLLDMRPCVFDRIDQLVLDDDTLGDDEQAFDPEAF